MKPLATKFLAFCVMAFLTHQTTTAQDKKLKFHAASFGVGITSSSSETAKSGPGVNMDFSTITNNHILSFNFGVGIDLNSGGPDEQFFEFNLTYGRKWSLAQDWVFEAHAGLGLFGYDIETGGSILFFDIPETTIGFPLRAKLIYYPFEKFGIGLNPNINFNSIHTAYSANLIVQYNFN